MTLIPTLMAIILFFVIVGYASLRYDQKKWNKIEQEDKKWLEEENKKPKSYIQFTIQGGVVRVSEEFNPSLDRYFDEYVIKRTSEDIAALALKKMYKRGYFTDKEGLTYPSCNVKHAFVTTEYKDIK